MNPTLSNISTSTKSRDLIQNTSPSLKTHSPHTTIKLPRIQIFKTGFRKLWILSKFWEWCIRQGVRGRGVIFFVCHYDALILGLLLQSNLYTMTTLGTTQKLLSWAGGHLIKHFIKQPLSKCRFLVFFPTVIFVWIKICHCTFWCHSWRLKMF